MSELGTNVLSRRRVKRRRLTANPFIDGEAGVTWSNAEDEDELGEDLLDDLEEDEDEEEDAQDFASIHNAVGAPVTRLEAAIAPVISRLESGAMHRTQNEEDPVAMPDPFLDNIMRMPAARDPLMWRVRVHESDQTHALWVIHDRLEITPHLAISASSSLYYRGWIAIESTSIAAVNELCQNVSAIPQPPRIEFISPDERIECLRVPYDRPRTDCPGWARVKSRAVLHQLGVDERLTRFSKDLVLIHNAASYPLVDFFAVPRLPPTYSELHLFSEGFESASNHSFKMTVSTKEFMQLSWEKYIRAPLEVGHRVRVSIQQQRIEATVVEVSYDYIVVDDNTSPGVQHLLHSDEAKRIFTIGDTVKVYASPSHHGRQGWVINVQDEDVAVVDFETKTDFTVKSWQLVPCEFDIVHSGMIQNSPFPLTREYDRFNELVNQRVLIVGQTPNKGLRGRIQQHVLGRVVRVELESGARTIDVHINSLVATTRSGPRLRDYYDENHSTLPVPITDYVASGMPLHSPTRTRAPTPLPFENGDEDDVWSVWNPRAPTPTIENGDDVGDSCASTPLSQTVDSDEPPICFDSRVLAHNWLMNSGLASVRISVRVASSRPSHLSAGFVNGTLEGKKGMIMSARSNGEDFDYLIKSYRKTSTDISKNLQVLGKLKKEVEKAKHALSSQQSVRIEIESFEDSNVLMTKPESITIKNAKGRLSQEEIKRMLKPSST
ncbi:hypothetical protein JOM56_006921 [Amanita muscaria]